METVEAHVGKMEAELKQWGARLYDLLAKADASGAGAKTDHRKQLEDLLKKYMTAEKRLAELKAGGRGKWDTFKGGVETAWRELETAFTRLVN